MLYGMEAVAVTKAKEKRLEVEEMRMLRFSLGKTRMDRIRNETVRTTLKVGELSGKLRETRLRWYGHVLRWEEEYVDQRTRKMVVGTRRRGWPRRRWVDCIWEDMRLMGMMEVEALDRNNWRRRIHTGNPTYCGNEARRRRRHMQKCLLTQCI